MDTTEKVPAIEITGNNRKEVTDTVVREYSFSLFLNGKELVTLLCSPTGLDYLIAGYLFSQEIIKSRDDIIEINLDETKGRAEVTTIARAMSDVPQSKRLIGSSGAREVQNYSGLSNTITPVESRLKVPANRIFDLISEFIRKSELFKDTGGVHSAAICSLERFTCYSDDIGRHNAVDRVIGECIMKNIPREDKLLLTSGRISSEILLKAARAGIPIAISKSAVTDSAIKYADKFGITLAGFVRGQRMMVYATSSRIMAE
jgi:FdhD protein